jgi:hypothetical protein
MAACREYDNAPSSSLTDREFPDQIDDCRLLTE